MTHTSRDSAWRATSHRVHDAIVPIAISLIVLLIGYIRTSIDLTWPIILAGTGVGLLASVLGYIGATFGIRRLSDDLAASAMLSITPTSDPAYSRWLSETLLMTDEELANFERMTECEDIWVITNDLHLDVPDEAEAPVDLGRIVRYNIRRREVRYVYLLPDDALVRRKVNHHLLEGLTSRERDQVKVVYLSPSEWNELPYLDGDFAIYNPARNPPKNPPVVYFEVPHHTHRHWCALPTPIADKWIGRICSIVPDIDKFGSP